MALLELWVEELEYEHREVLGSRNPGPKLQAPLPRMLLGGGLGIPTPESRLPVLCIGVGPTLG